MAADDLVPYKFAFAVIGLMLGIVWTLLWSGKMFGYIAAKLINWLVLRDDEVRVASFSAAILYTHAARLLKIQGTTVVFLYAAAANFPKIQIRFVLVLVLTRRNPTRLSPARAFRKS